MHDRGRESYLAVGDQETAQVFAISDVLPVEHRACVIAQTGLEKQSAQFRKIALYLERRDEKLTGGLTIDNLGEAGSEAH